MRRLTIPGELSIRQRKMRTEKNIRWPSTWFNRTAESNGKYWDRQLCVARRCYRLFFRTWNMFFNRLLQNKRFFQYMIRIVSYAARPLYFVAAHFIFIKNKTIPNIPRQLSICSKNTPQSHPASPRFPPLCARLTEISLQTGTAPYVFPDWAYTGSTLKTLLYLTVLPWRNR